MFNLTKIVIISFYGYGIPSRRLSRLRQEIRLSSEFSWLRPWWKIWLDIDGEILLSSLKSLFSFRSSKYSCWVFTWLSHLDSSSLSVLFLILLNPFDSSSPSASFLLIWLVFFDFSDPSVSFLLIWLNSIVSWNPSVLCLFGPFNCVDLSLILLYPFVYSSISIV